MSVFPTRARVDVNYRFRKRERIERTSSLFMTRDARPASVQRRTFIRVLWSLRLSGVKARDV